MPIHMVPPPTKEVFLPANNGTDRTSSNYHPGYRIDADAEYADIEFMVPHDFHSIVALELVWIALGAVSNMLMNITVRYSGDGEGVTVHSGSTSITRTTQANYTYRDSISAALTALAPLDHVAIDVARPASGNANALILGVRLRYT